jgi:hypothetical protein
MNKIQDGSNMTGTDFFKTIISTHLLAHVRLNVVNTFFPMFWKHPDALFKKGLWLAAYPHTNQSRSYLNHLVYSLSREMQKSIWLTSFDDEIKYWHSINLTFSETSYGCPYREVTHVSELMLACSQLMKFGVCLLKYISSAIGNSCFVPFNKENLKNLHVVSLQLEDSCMSRDQMVRTSYTFP